MALRTVAQRYAWRLETKPRQTWMSASHISVTAASIHTTQHAQSCARLSTNFCCPSIPVPRNQVPCRTNGSHGFLPGSVLVSRMRDCMSGQTCNRWNHSWSVQNKPLFPAAISLPRSWTQIKLGRTFMVDLIPVAPCSTVHDELPSKGADPITFIDSEEDHELFVEQLQNKLQENHQGLRTHAVSIKNLRPLVSRLLAYGCECRNISAFLETNHGILAVKSEQILRVIDFLEELGLSWPRLLKALGGNTRLWKASVDHMQLRVALLRKLGFVEGRLQKVVADWSQVLTLGSTELKTVVRTLMDKCGFTKADVVTILSECPSILAENPDTLEVKFQYVYFRMGITDNSKMARAKIFKYSLDHLRCRHLILERLGVYVPPDNRGRFSKKNPALTVIMDSSDGRFASKVAGVSGRELQAFARVLQEEVKRERDGEALSDDNESSDDDKSGDDDDSWKDGFEFD
ncbi:transcription termination factor 4, mitochondrial-like [Diadema setosum]|uniref:transcription termination factor 4, mitochondrial-like n=1 Tax=Diadema setosum TaxID=31175 RepID=UPI003B3B023B